MVKKGDLYLHFFLLWQVNDLVLAFDARSHSRKPRFNRKEHIEYTYCPENTPAWMRDPRYIKDNLDYRTESEEEDFVAEAGEDTTAAIPFSIQSVHEPEV